MIELEDTVLFEAPQELLWEMILDPDVLARIVPGCDQLVVVNENEYQGQMRIKLGPMDGVFRGTVALSDLQAPQSFHLIINGRGPSGIINGEGDVRLSDVGNGTEFSYTGQGQISGRMASVGQRVMNSSAKAIAKQSLENLDKQVQARVHPQPVAEEAPAGETQQPGAIPAAEGPPPAPSQSDFFLGVAENLLEEYVPDPQQRKVLLSLGIATVLILAINWFANLVARRVVNMLEEESS
jgi:carbon monoxide dehydrogenase subunit G